MRMDKRYFQSLGVELPRLGFGCMRFPTKDNKIDYDKAKEMIHYAMANGLNYFDTAYNYHNEDSERFLGKVLSEFPRESYYLTTKLPIWKVESELDAERLFNEQLEKLQTDYFDFYFLHAMDAEKKEIMDKFNLYDFILKKKEEGKIKHIGFSFHDTREVLEDIISGRKWDVVQLQINYWDWNEIDAKSLYEVLEKHNIPCFVMEPVRGGFLSSFAPQVERHMKEYSPNSISSWAIRWVSSLPNVAVVLSGMSNMEQLKDNISTLTNFKPLNDEELKIIDKVIEGLKSINPVPCTACRYCMDCAFGVDIPRVFKIYNDYKKTENKEITRRSYFNFLKEEKRADKCEKCEACVSKCPQHIDIPSELEKIHGELVAL